MSHINVLDKTTIDKIAAGEVVDRPSSIVKEMLENAIDAKSTAITIEIKEGGISFIRITDNGEGIQKEDLENAFLRHATSKIKNIEDLLSVHSLGFRGEALSSISAVAQVECITKTPTELTGYRYVIEGGEKKSLEEIGAPAGTTFIIRNIFFNTPARRKFLKTATTEGSYISAIVERLALSHPEVSIRFINNSQNKLYTSGNSKLKEIIYSVYGRDVTANLIEINESADEMKLTGFIGKPLISRGNRNYMNYFINGRYIKSKIINSAIEDAYKPFLMQHNYPFCVLHFTIDSSKIDVNVHPAKMEIRFDNQSDIYNFIYNAVSCALQHKELIPEAIVDSDHEQKSEKTVSNSIKSGNTQNETKPIRAERIPEPFEKKREEIVKQNFVTQNKEELQQLSKPSIVTDNSNDYVAEKSTQIIPEQMDLFETKFLSEVERKKHKMIGQLFDTYWLIEYDNNLYIIDQHAAHEKVLYEKTMKMLKNKEYTSQQLNPPIILTLSQRESELINMFSDDFKSLGYEIESFGGKEYAVRAVPANLFSIGQKELLMDLIDSLSYEANGIKSELILEKIASMSCKAAVKGNNHLSMEEANALIEQLLQLDNPYNCPHGRPTIISMSKYEIEKKFKRIV